MRYTKGAIIACIFLNCITHQAFLKLNNTWKDYMDLVKNLISNFVGISVKIYGNSPEFDSYNLLYLVDGNRLYVVHYIKLVLSGLRIIM